jgi:hypothetical protein
MKLISVAAGCVALALAVPGGAVLHAQQGLWLEPDLPMAPQFDRGQPVSPFFEGWYVNPDGTYTLAFGYFNRNAKETLEIPIGPDNFIEPAEFDGDQPTTFPAQPDYSIAGREWGVFAVVVPAEYAAPGRDVVWTLRSKGATHRVPGRVGNSAYQLQALDQPMGRGSLPPRIRFESAGPEGLGPKGITTGPLQTRVGVPLPLTLWATDSAAPDTRNPVAVGLTWFKHQGPPQGQVRFDPEQLRVDGTGAEGTTSATFSEPGDYVVRVRVDNWSSSDSADQRLCCWTNGYVKVVVTP